MKTYSKFLGLLLMFVMTMSVYAQRPKKVMITGTLHENVEMTIGNTGRKEIITQLPYQFNILKDQLPVTLTFRSDNYQYYQIVVPRKPYDSTGHIYLMKIDEAATERMQSKANKGHVQYNDVDEGSSELQNARSSDVDMQIPLNKSKSENTYVVIIANENYEDPTEDVAYAHNDGDAFQEYCVKTLGIPAKHIRMRKDATLNNINSEISWMHRIAETAGEDARFLFYYAGHGVPNGEEDAYLLPVDGDGSRPESGYSMKKLNEEFAKLPAQSTFVFMDACFSGAKRGGNGMVAEARGVAIRVKSETPKGKVVVFSAAQGDQTAHKFEEKKHGLFTYFLLKKLQESRGKATLKELSEYITKQVRRNSLIEEDKEQTPSTYYSPEMINVWEKMTLGE